MTAGHVIVAGMAVCVIAVVLSNCHVEQKKTLTIGHKSSPVDSTVQPHNLHSHDRIVLLFMVIDHKIVLCTVHNSQRKKAELLFFCSLLNPEVMHHFHILYLLRFSNLSPHLFLFSVFFHRTFLPRQKRYLLA